MSLSDMASWDNENRPDEVARDLQAHGRTIRPPEPPRRPDIVEHVPLLRSREVARRARADRSKP